MSLLILYINIFRDSYHQDNVDIIKTLANDLFFHIERRN